MSPKRNLGVVTFGQAGSSCGAEAASEVRSAAIAPTRVLAFDKKAVEASIDSMTNVREAGRSKILSRSSQT